MQISVCNFLLLRHIKINRNILNLQRIFSDFKLDSALAGEKLCVSKPFFFFFFKIVHRNYEWNQNNNYLNQKKSKRHACLIFNYMYEQACVCVNIQELS